MQIVRTGSATLSRLPWELFHSIGLEIPLNILSSTLLWLSLTNKHIYDKTRSLLYFRLVLAHEDAAAAVFDTIQRTPSIGNIVREVYVLSERSIEMLARTVNMRSYKFLGGLKDIVSQGLLPNLTSIGIYKQSRWTFDGIPMSHVQDYSLSESFWGELASMAPRLRHVTVRMLADDFLSPWVDFTVVERIAVHKRLAVFSLSIGELDLDVDSAPIKVQLLKNVEIMQHSIRSLTLGPPEIYKENDITPIISLVFDNLRTLELHGFGSADSPGADNALEMQGKVVRAEYNNWTTAKPYSSQGVFKALPNIVSGFS
ncbi:hypothetical protein D9619_009933 [Psilocybe cf. subviscida]|uniref:Uncharacterized protein n=1 Tax=Psilocybe cf. subviscida TaxID=2480587 RepID=A0A8H5BKV9_9AGAR|nr:hypothetical protein D9619_009933 [Psilocybe cf. subviscida]